MNTWRQTIGGGLLTLVVIGLAAGVLHARDATHPLSQSRERLMYLRSGAVARRVFLDFNALAADVYWIRTIQHYGRDRKSDRTATRFELLQPLLDLTTTLDPHFNIAYRFGAIFLSMPEPTGPGRTDQAIALLEKGLKADPTRWQYAHDIGFVNYWYTHNYEEAARWFQKAADMPNAPEWIRPLAAVTLAEGGDRTGAHRILTELLSSDLSYIREAAQRALDQLRALDAIDELQALVARYHATTGQAPRGWADLIRAGLLRGVPADASHTAFVYDPDSETVSLSVQSPLAPLPQALKKR